MVHHDCFTQLKTHTIGDLEIMGNVAASYMAGSLTAPVGSVITSVGYGTKVNHDKLNTICFGVASGVNGWASDTHHFGECYTYPSGTPDPSAIRLVQLLNAPWMPKV